MISFENVLEAQNMVEKEKLDIRTITMGISLLDCIDSDSDKSCEKIYNKITREAKNLVTTADKVSRAYGIPIINKRISVTPIAIIAQASEAKNYTKYAKVLDKAAKELNIDFIGGFSALVEKGCTKGDRILIESIPQALAETDRICASINVGSTKAGINMDAVKKMGEVIKRTAECTKSKESIGCAKLVVFTNAVSDNPFMAGAFLGVEEAETVINVGISGPGVVKSALEKVKGESFDDVSEVIKRTTFKITRAGQMIAKEISKIMDVKLGIVDLSLAPTPAVGDSVARILEEIGVSVSGTHGTTAALALLNDAVKKGGVMAANHVGGLSGAFIPVSEDEGMIAAVQSGAMSIDKLEAMTCVCSVGLDMIAIPGETPASIISGMIADEMAIGMINQKTTAVRVIPAYNRKEGDVVHFGGLLGTAPVMAVNKNDCKNLINSGGRIPAPIHSFKN
ncbi:MAG TPA: PFL family protein [Clostridia bacterium]|nr:PFL family protein [Clostridia bacterium]